MQIRLKLKVIKETVDCLSPWQVMETTYRILPKGLELITERVTDHGGPNEEFEFVHDRRPGIVVGKDTERIYSPQFPRLHDSNANDLKKVLQLARENHIQVNWNHDPGKPTVRGWMTHSHSSIYEGTPWKPPIWLDWFKADIFTVIHEVGHVLLGPMCCSAHEELAVYQFVRAAHKALNLSTPLGNHGRQYRDQFLLDSMLCETWARKRRSKLPT